MAAPKLRFKEFDADWISNKIIDLADYVDYRGKTPKKVESGILLVTAKNIKQGYLDYSVSQEFIEPSDFDEVMRRGKVELNDVLITTEAPLGNVASVDRTDIALAQRVIKYRGKIDLLDNLFLKQKFLSESFQEILKSKATGGTVQGIKCSVLHQIPLIVPSKQEQTKIASFLSNVDEKISQLTQKHELLSQYKQGMMQKLFSQQIRFKADDGSEFGEWEEVKFSGIFNFHQTNSYSRALLAEYGEIMNIHYGDIHTKFSMLFDVNKESVPFLNDEVDTSKIAKEQFLKVGDLVIADASEDYKDIGKSIEVISLNNQKVVAGLHTYIARPVKPFALGFCGYMMQTFPVREQIKKLATGISVLGISKTNLGKVELKVPSLEEQTKIANFLSAIDQKIEVVVQQIEQAKQWKKGLLQQMFV